jgi:RimJ/RimL family protein N-acetyltransferase
MGARNHMITEDNFIDFRCPYCGGQASFPRDHGDFAHACPSCNESVIVPADGAAVGRKLPLPITTARLMLRRFGPGDWKDLLECLSDDELFRYMDGAPLQEDDILRWLEQDSVVKLTTPETTFFLGLELRPTGKLIGYASLSLADPQRLQAELNLCVRSDHQRQGLATEAVAGILGFCFLDIHLHRVSARCDARNEAARALLEHARLRSEGQFVKNKLFNGEWVDTLHFAILRDEYQSPPTPIQKP